jgi:biofilm PGA synthesis N-glycosyltransferase PgaC
MDSATYDNRGLSWRLWLPSLRDQLADYAMSNVFPSRPSRRYCVISPCRNEEDHLPETIRTVAAQTVPPTLWVIVDDGSTDATPIILEQAMQNYPFIQMVRRPDSGKRSVGPGVVDAFYAGLETVNLDDYDYLCKLDADLELPPRYFERLMEEMEAEPWLGTVSGKVFIRDTTGHEFHEVRGDENSIGPAKFYRVQTFREVGGFVRHVGWDGVDGHQCRAYDWLARSIMCEELKILHRRQTGSSDRSVYRGRLRDGLGLWFKGNSLPYVLARSVSRALGERPRVTGALCTLWGYLRAMGTRHERYGDAIYRQQIRRFERRALLWGKRRALELHDREILARRRNQRNGNFNVHDIS